MDELSGAELHNLEALPDSAQLPPTRLVDPALYLELIERLCARAREISPAPDSVIGMKRSGLFPAVYLSEQLRLPMLVNTEADSFPFPRLQRPLIVDTTAWTGTSLRRTSAKLKRRGVERVITLVMFARLHPAPLVEDLIWLETSARIPRLWYDPD